MALFSRRKKSADDVVADQSETQPDTEGAEVAPDADAASVTDAASAPDAAPEQAEVAPTIGISVQAFRGVGAQAGPEVALPDPDATAAAPSATAGTAAPSAPAAAPEPVRRLPLAPALPPEQTETVAGMKDNVLLRESLKEIEQGATNEQLLGVLRQALQGHLYIRVNGDARAQISEGKPLAVAVVRDGERQFMLGFSSAAAVRDSVQLEKDPAATSAVAQPVTSVLQQVVSGDFAGLIVDNASTPHRVVFPTELLQKALEQADVDMTVKSLIAAPRQQDSEAKVGEALAKTRMWVAVNEGGTGGQVGIAEAQTPDGRRFLQLFSHPLEVLALGRGDRPLPFEPSQLASLLSNHLDMAGVIIDPAGPSIVVERDALTSVLIMSVDVGE
ncbi:SseB family protein [Microbacterium sp. ANT_H45B]|uniref:SseB family protein n=1 Tax=Microbacterium sp. ANT_H45B TaxID=2597346 RepID=UPI0011ED410D|nr:SseB family protein [Microbacterium sp. ANT_H45B]KAA0959766.1 SseB family protein [Microbacterium sp. ANT_H45B]